MKYFFKHLSVVLRHKYEVFKLSIKCGIPFRGLIHDLSKFSYVPSNKKYASIYKYDNKNKTLSLKGLSIINNPKNTSFKINYYEEWMNPSKRDDCRVSAK